MPRRRREHAARRRTASFTEQLADRGWTYRRIARFLRIAPRTLWRWRHDLAETPTSLGRPVARSPLVTRTQILRALDATGPGLGVPTLREHFPQVARAELADLLTRYRRVWRERNRVPLEVLEWTIPGRVWAIDFTHAPSTIDGQYRYLLAVRDLASGMTLLWHPVTEMTAAEATTALAGLFTVHGTPLVLKSDNGSHFTAAAMQNLTRMHRVAHLFSPPYYPQYNGSIEAGIGSLAGRTMAAAARRGHPGEWTWDDVSTAMRDANETARPRGPSGPSPTTLWTNRTAIREEEGERFTARVNSRIGAGADCGLWEPGLCLDREIARAAIHLALVECGYLRSERRRILPPIRRPKVA